MIRLIKTWRAKRKLDRLARAWRESYEGKRYIAHRNAALLGHQRRRARG